MMSRHLYWMKQKISRLNKFRLPILLIVFLLFFTNFWSDFAIAVQRNRLMASWTQLVLGEGIDLFWVYDRIDKAIRVDLLSFSEELELHCKNHGGARKELCFRIMLANKMAFSDVPLSEKASQYIAVSNLTGEDLRYSMLLYGVRVALGHADYLIASKIMRNLPLDYVPDSEGKRNALGHVLKELAVKFAEEDNFEEAEYYWRWAIKQKGNEASYYHGLGWSLYAQKRWLDAMKAFQKAIQLDPSKASSHAGLGHSFDQQNRWDEAVSSYLNAIRLEPEEIRYYIFVARALKNKGEPQMALMYLDVAHEISPTNETVQNLLKQFRDKNGK